jgi:hypothetical protein
VGMAVAPITASASASRSHVGTKYLHARVRLRAIRVRGPGTAGPLSVTLSTVELDEGGDELAVHKDLAARDLGCVRKSAAEVLVAKLSRATRP